MTLVMNTDIMNLAGKQRQASCRIQILKQSFGTLEGNHKKKLMNVPLISLNFLMRVVQQKSVQQIKKSELVTKMPNDNELIQAVYLMRLPAGLLNSYQIIELMPSDQMSLALKKAQQLIRQDTTVGN